MKKILCGIAIVAMIFAGSTVQATGLFGTETSGNVSIGGYQGAGINTNIGAQAGGEAAADYKAYGFPCASGQAGANGTFNAGTFGTLSSNFAAVNSGAQASGLFPTVNYSGKVEGNSWSGIGNTSNGASAGQAGSASYSGNDFGLFNAQGGGSAMTAGGSLTVMTPFTNTATTGTVAAASGERATLSISGSTEAVKNANGMGGLATSKYEGTTNGSSIAGNGTSTSSVTIIGNTVSAGTQSNICVSAGGCH